MSKDIKDIVKQKMKDGWIRSQMFIEVMAINEEAAKDALQKHVQKLENEKGVLLSKIDWKESRKVEKPFPNVPEAYSYVVELEVLTEGYERLVFVAMNYGPSSVEVLEPEEIKLKAWEADGIVNSIADIMHNFAARGAGGIILKRV